MIATILSAIVFAVVVVCAMLRWMWLMAGKEVRYPAEISEDEYR